MSQPGREERYGGVPGTFGRGNSLKTSIVNGLCRALGANASFESRCDWHAESSELRWKLGAPGDIVISSRWKLITDRLSNKKGDEP